MRGPDLPVLALYLPTVPGWGFLWQMLFWAAFTALIFWGLKKMKWL